MTGVEERRCGGTYNCKPYAQVSGRSVAIVTTRTQHRTAVTAHFLLRTFVLLIYPPVAFPACRKYHIGLRTHGNRRIFQQCGRRFKKIFSNFLWCCRPCFWARNKMIFSRQRSSWLLGVRLRSGVFIMKKMVDRSKLHDNISLWFLYFYPRK